VLFQEFHWISIRSRGWKDYSWPDRLQYSKACLNTFYNSRRRNHCQLF
jgi:hypothetical protein